MPTEIFILVLVSMGGGMFMGIVSMILKYLREQSEGLGGPSLTTSELEAMMRRAVEEANAPLLGRVEAIEERLEALPRLAAHGDEWLDEEEPEAALQPPRLARRATR